MSPFKTPESAMYNYINTASKLNVTASRKNNLYYPNIRVKLEFCIQYEHVTIHW